MKIQICPAILAIKLFCSLRSQKKGRCGSIPGFARNRTILPATCTSEASAKSLIARIAVAQVNKLNIFNILKFSKSLT
jgi:hypothetical protein